MAARVGLDSLLDRQFEVGEGGPPQASWIEAALGVLPFILGILIMSVPQLIVVAGWATWEGSFLSTGQNIFGILILVATLGMLIYSWRMDWPRWTATWYIVFGFLLFSPLLLLSSYFEDNSRIADVFSELLAAFLLPLLIAWVLYLVIRKDPFKSLLAVIPIVVLIWQPNMEFVPDQIEAPITIISLILAGLTTVALLRWVNWRLGLWLVIMLNIVVGMQFAYAGIYHGGSLPFVAPGPSLVEVLKNFIPQFLAISTIILGPFLAASFRSIGRVCGTGGALGYHLVLLGMFLILAGTMANFFMVWDDRLSIYRQPIELLYTVFFLLGLFCYVSGVILLEQAAVTDYTLPGWLVYILLIALTLTLPLVLMMPVRDIYGHHSDQLYIFGHLLAQPSLYLNSFGLVWMILTIWLITHRQGRAAENGQVVKTATDSRV